MSTLETLHLRMVGDDLDDLVRVVRRAVESQGDTHRVRVYRHSRVQGDLLVHLYRDGSSRTDTPSELGLQLAALLRMHGLLEHSVWLPTGLNHEEGD